MDSVEALLGTVCVGCTILVAIALSAAVFITP